MIYDKLSHIVSGAHCFHFMMTPNLRPAFMKSGQLTFLKTVRLFPFHLNPARSSLEDPSRGRLLELTGSAKFGHVSFVRSPRALTARH